MSDRWSAGGLDGLVDYVVSSTANALPYSDWLRHRFRQAQSGIRNAFSKSDQNLQDSIAQFSRTLNWPHNWIRCMAIHSGGQRIAVCQNDDCIRIFSCDPDRRPITLKHQQQQNVTDMAWKPYGRMVLAVACSHAVLIWRLDKQNVNIRPSVNCAEVIDLSSFSPIIQCFWDSLCSEALFIASAASSRLQVFDTSCGEGETVGSWIHRGHIRRFFVSPDGCKLAVAYDLNFISVYDRHTWREERWKKLGGPCVAAVWTPQSDVLLFATLGESIIYAIHFTKKLQNFCDDQRSFSSGSAVPVYDLAEVKSEEGDNRGFAGSVRDLQISPDGQRVALTFDANPAVIWLFMIITVPTFFFTPTSLINGAATFGAATIVSFFQKFKYGSLLTVVSIKSCVYFVWQQATGPVGDRLHQINQQSKFHRCIAVKRDVGLFMLAMPDNLAEDDIKLLDHHWAKIWANGKLQYIPLLYGPHAIEGVHLNMAKKEKSVDEGRSGDALLIEPVPAPEEVNSSFRGNNIRSGSSSSSSSVNSAPSSLRSDNLQLFSSVGLYDQLVSKAAQKTSAVTQ
ncbi:unnamed protein product [Gongylonema pulchrum]|uniref:WD_REPEATS_REGION domain-containing protein n=1 Tax=Gongylonema pulchrum TaxID=637853 RepID=A0A183DY98_9BILA|nr:unnamed protein product [Gongylonema pulchrum]